MARTKGKVKAIPDEVDNPVAHLKIEIDLRKLHGEFMQMGIHKSHRHTQGQRDAKGTPRFRGQATYSVFCRDRLLDDAVGMLIPKPPGFRDVNAPRGAVEQAHAEFLFHARQHTGDGGGCKAEHACGLRDPGVRAERHVFVGSKAPWFDITDPLPQHEEY